MEKKEQVVEKMMKHATISILKGIQENKDAKWFSTDNQGYMEALVTLKSLHLMEMITNKELEEITLKVQEIVKNTIIERGVHKSLEILN